VNQLTIRGFDPELDRRVRELARQEGISLNKAVLKLLRKGAGLREPEGASNRIGSELDDLIGTWTHRQADEVLDAVQAFEAVDEELWR